MKRNVIILIFYLILFLSNATAQKMSIGFIFPAGGQTGKTSEIEIGGLNIGEATEVIISGTGLKAEILPQDLNNNPAKLKNNKRAKLDDQSSPQLAERIRIKVSIEKNATPGLRDLRLKSVKGVSNKLSFEVGQYPDLIEVKGSTNDKPTEVEQLPATLCGQIFPGEIDYFGFRGEKGMKLVASVKARIFVPFIADAVPGWFQPVISLKNSKGKEIAYNDDYRNSVDPVIIITLPESDNYLLSIRDAIYRGRDDFNYRIELGEIPFLESVYPCVGKTGKSTSLNLKGINLDKTKVQYKPTYEGYGEFTATGKNGFISNPVTFYSFPNNAKIDYSASEKPKELFETILFDSLQSPRQIKKYLISAQKNEKIAIDLKGRRLGSIMDAKMTLRDESGKKLIEVDDVEDASQGMMTHHADPVLRYRFLQTGNYILEVADVTGNFGKDCYYVLERMANLPEIQTFVSPANLIIPSGGTAIFRVDISSDEKVIPELDFEIKGLPKGFYTSNLKSQPGSKFWEMSVTAPLNAKPGRLAIEVLTSGKTKGKDQTTFSQKASAADDMMQAFYYTHHIPSAGFEAEIVQASPFSLHFSSEIEENLQKAIVTINPKDTLIRLNLRIIKNEGFNEPIDLVLTRKNQMITMNPTQVLPHETEKTVLIRFNAKALQKLKRMRYGLSISGTVNGEIEKKGKRSFQNALYREVTPILMLQKNE